MKLKIYIVGNGFDIAHRLKTFYHDFYNSYINKVKIEYLSTANNQNVLLQQLKTTQVKNPFFIQTSINKNKIPIDVWNGININEPLPEYCSVEFHELAILQKQNLSVWWSDFEYRYFSLLKLALSKDPTSNSAKLINDNLEIIKIELEKYLTNVTKERKLLPDFKKIFANRFGGNSASSKSIDLNEEFVILNFNYTKIPEEYIVKQRTTVINIHGQLNDTDNPIIFGLGDEYSNEYLEFENTNNNEFIKNLKSNKYLLTQEYSKLFHLISMAEEIKIDIIGHSCGLSDRSLLRELFQQDKIKQDGIRIYHHDGKKSYSETLYGISRIFEKNVEMRTKVQSYDGSLKTPQLLE